ncbi:hypothetical protein RHDC3_02185 [Rhodocyclaceae bacterium]|nr:hypothetical protein RHDC3_02185 [Rhodocyclaceae bacterium]
MQQKVSRWIVSLMVGVALAVSVPVLAAPKAGDVKAVAGPVDLNAATQAELEKLPGVGPAAAKKIIAGRPYASTSELSTKAKLPAKTVEKISPLVTVGAGAKAAATPAVMPSVPKPAATVPAVKTPKVPKAAAPANVVVPPAGKGMVWVNPDSKVYHKEGSRWYGKTKKGSYMTEAEAVRAGYRAPKQGGKEQ